MLLPDHFPESVPGLGCITADTSSDDARSDMAIEASNWRAAVRFMKLLIAAAAVLHITAAWFADVSVEAPCEASLGDVT